MEILVHKNLLESTIKHSLNNMSEAKIKLSERLQSAELKIYNFKTNINDGVYHFDFYSDVLNLGIQLDGYSFCFDETFNSDSIKTFTVGCKSMRVIKITDYQIIIDMDQVVRYLKNEFIPKFEHKLIA